MEYKNGSLIQIKMNIATKIRRQLDTIHEALDNQDYVISVVSDRYLPKKWDMFSIRHYHHIDKIDLIITYET